MEFSMANNEKVLTPSTIETIDMAIFSLIDEGFDLHTRTNTGFRKVPVLWMSPERAVNSKDKDIRDSVGKLKLPLISVDRTSFNKDPTFKGGWQAHVFPDTNGPRGYKKHQRLVSRKIAQDPTRKFAQSEAGQTYRDRNFPHNNSKVVYEETYAPIPVWVTVNYSVTLRTEYQQQMNDLMTPFATRTGLINALFAEYNGHRYETFIQGDLSMSNNTANLGEDERMFQTKVDLKVLGYLLGDGENEEAPKITTRETVTEVKIIRERSIVGDTKPWESDDDSFREF
jgi:hypothetical protein